MSLRSAQSGRSDGLSRLLSPGLGWVLLLGVGVHLAGFLLFRVVSNPLPVTEEKRPFILFLPDQAMSEGALLEARASLFDSAPLFVPTKWSTTARIYPDFEGQEISAFEDYSPSIALVDELRPQRSFGLEEYSVERPEDLLALPLLRPLESFGQEQTETTEVDEWHPIIHVQVIGRGESASSANAKSLRADRLSALPSVDRPVRCYITISASGRLLSGPIMVDSSGRAEIDSKVIDWLVDPSTIAQLPAGYLEVSVFL